MKYASDFLPKMSAQALGMTMRHSGKDFENKIRSDITYPEYYHEFGEFDRLEFTQGQHYVDIAHYDRTDQILCAVDGDHIQVALVPHVYRQEMIPQAETSYFHEKKNYNI